jgi:hypothetical protein
MAGLEVMAGTDGYSIIKTTVDGEGKHVIHANSIQSGTWDVRNVTGTLSLPTGAATSAKQDSIVSAIQASNTITRPVSLASIPLAQGAASDAKLEVIRTTLTAGLTISAGNVVSAISQATDLVTNNVQISPTTLCHVLYASAASTNSTMVSSQLRVVKSVTGYNAATSARYLKLYNKASVPVVGSDTPFKVLYLPPSASFHFSWPSGIQFNLGVGYGLTTGPGSADTAAVSANDILVMNVDYR